MKIFSAIRILSEQNNFMQKYSRSPPPPVNEKSYFDEYEMLCTRGASPPSFDRIDFNINLLPSLPNDHYLYNQSAKERRELRRKNDLRLLNRPKQTDVIEKNGICFKNYKGECTAAGQCSRSHEFRATRKMEICKFFLLGFCAKAKNCLYMHSEFPCKHYYLDIMGQHDPSTCLLMHGGPLSNDLQKILLKHINTAPPEILGNFPKFKQSQAREMLRIQNEKLKVLAETGGHLKDIQNVLAQRTSVDEISTEKLGLTKFCLNNKSKDVDLRTTLFIPNNSSRR